jgi:prepilin-type N-terminal cleavage/methylation domain-containing protein
MKNKKLQSGYTLIELLAVMIILVAVGTIITSILVSTLRSGDKSTTTNDIRQTGNYAIAQMSKMIAYAKSFDGVSIDGTTFVDNCVPPSSQNYISVKISSFDGGQTTFRCTKDGIYGVLSSNSATLIDTGTIDATTCYFTCSQNNISTSPTIDINLTLQRKHASTFTLLPEAQTVIDFQTSVTLRNNGLQ